MPRPRPRPGHNRPSCKTLGQFRKNNGKKWAFKKPGPAPRKREHRLIRHTFTDRLNFARAATHLKLACRARTARLNLNNFPDFRVFAQGKTSFFSEENRLKRPTFARDDVNRLPIIWKNVIYSNETVSRLDGPNGHKKTYQHERTD
ncbi:hypothetical protein FVE85_2566 [Porphyridium purpureum]|uniref:Uncharacterized protein n=1 Tax=Porphyridium purpureum TaxID=35688 RepID=A0A5J4YJD1_PORPP|nr:hypothetical protein FVE85_2566 [Porphyridium purpureum]|eukprot:POR7406..scf291_13